MSLVELVPRSVKLRVVFDGIVLVLLDGRSLVRVELFKVGCQMSRRADMMLCLLETASRIVADRTCPPAGGTPRKSELVETFEP